jgi:hypothetical protein
MNYQDIPFLIWAEDQKIGEAIKAVLGRKANTTVESGPIEVLAAFVQKSSGFNCVVLHASNNMTHLNDLIDLAVKKCPVTPVIAFSFNEISLAQYQNLIRLGAADVLVYTESVDQVALLEGLLRILNQRWYLYRCFEREKKRMYDATVVTAYHEINQALTVLINAVGLFKMEIEHESVDIVKLDKISDFLLKGTNRIQEILLKLKRVKEPVLKEYTPGVAMVCLETPADSSPAEKSLEQIYKEQIEKP